MNSSNQPVKGASDEIDFIELIANAILAIKKNMILIIAAAVIGAVLGWAYYQLSPKIFESNVLILTESYSKSLIDNANELIQENNALTLSEKLNLTLEQASSIVAIQILSAVEKPSEIPKPGETPKDIKLYLTINVKMIDNSSWTQVQNGLVYYFQNNEFVKTRTEQEKKYIIQVIDQIDAELVDLEKLKARISEQDLAHLTSLVLFDPSTVNTKILDLNIKKIDLQNSLEKVTGVQLVEGFTVFNKPSSPKLSPSLASGAALGLSIAFVLIAFNALRSILKN